MTDNQNLDYLTDMALKTIVDVSQLGSSVLQPEYFNQYIQEATQNRTILSEARRIVMNTQVYNIDRVGFGSRILQYVAENTAISTSDAPTFSQNVLTAKEFVALTGISDNALRRTLEQSGFESTLVSMFAEQAGIDWEEQAVFGDTGISAYDTVMKSQEGWIAKADSGQLLFDGGSGTDFDLSEDGYMAMFDAMIKAYPKEYFNQPSMLRLYCAWEEYDGFRTELATRETGLGDAVLAGNGELTYKGIPVKYAPVLNSAEGVEHMGRPCILVQPDNLVYGVFEDITIERDRVPKSRRTDFVLGMEIDQDFVNEKAISIAFPEEVEYPSS